MQVTGCYGDDKAASAEKLFPGGGVDLKRWFSVYTVIQGGCLVTCVQWAGDNIVYNLLCVPPCPRVLWEEKEMQRSEIKSCIEIHI